MEGGACSVCVCMCVCVFVSMCVFVCVCVCVCVCVLMSESNCYDACHFVAERSTYACVDVRE
jgi:hypothetical protein